MKRGVKATQPPLMSVPVRAGFPNPAQDADELPLNLNELVIKHPASTYFLRVEGDSMEDAGIFGGDLVVVDKSLEPAQNDVVVAAVDGEFTLKRFQRKGTKGYLVAANPSYAPIEVTEDNDFQIWGVVTYTIHQQRGPS